MDTVIHISPVGWWVSYKKDQWTGPFKDENEAHEAAKVIVPMIYPEYQLLRVMPWERKTCPNVYNELLTKKNRRSKCQD